MFANLGLQMKINRFSKIRTDRWNRVHKLSQVERCWIWREVASTNCPDLGNRFETINVRNKSQRVAQFVRKIML